MNLLPWLAGCASYLARAERLWVLRNSSLKNKAFKQSSHLSIIAQHAQRRHNRSINQCYLPPQIITLVQYPHNYLAKAITPLLLTDYDAAEHDGQSMEIARGLSEAFFAEFRSAHGLVVSTGELAQPAKEVRLRVKV